VFIVALVIALELAREAAVSGMGHGVGGGRKRVPAGRAGRISSSDARRAVRRLRSRPSETHRRSRRAAEVFRSRWTRLALRLLVAFLPAAGSELLGNAANLHFYLTYTCFWALVWSSETRTALATRGLVIAAATLSDPLTVLFAPLVVWRTRVRRTRRAFAVPVVFASGLAVQLVAIVLSEAPERLTPFDAADVPPLFALRVTGSLLVGDRFIDDSGSRWVAASRTERSQRWR
jgi:hypothetical protein